MRFRILRLIYLGLDLSAQILLNNFKFNMINLKIVRILKVYFMCLFAIKLMISLIGIMYRECFHNFFNLSTRQIINIIFFKTCSNGFRRQILFKLINKYFWSGNYSLKILLNTINNKTINKTINKNNKLYLTFKQKISY